jgi:hypothetical protein
MRRPSESPASSSRRQVSDSTVKGGREGMQRQGKDALTLRLFISIFYRSNEHAQASNTKTST